LLLEAVVELLVVMLLVGLVVVVALVVTGHLFRARTLAVVLPLKESSQLLLVLTRLLWVLVAAVERTLITMA